MSLQSKILNPSAPVTFFEMVPPAAHKPEAIVQTLEEAKEVRDLADAINLPEIYEEDRGKKRQERFLPRVAPRELGVRIQRELGTEVVINRVVVREPDQDRWFRAACDEFGVRHAVLVGGESSQIRYPGPSVLEAAAQLRDAKLPLGLGGITIPSRPQEAERIRRKHAAGLTFFTTQVLFDSNDIVGLIQRLNGLEARIFLSLAPVTHPRDVEFLRWLGVDIPADVERFLLGSESSEAAAAAAGSGLGRSLDLAQRILMDVFDNLPPDPPLLGLNVEHINRRNFGAAVKMLERLGNLYKGLVAARARASLA